MLALSFATALARIPGRVVGIPPGGDPSGYFYFFDNVIVGFNASQLDKTSRLSQFKLVSMTYGYGYGYTDTPTQLALAVMVAYCIVTLIYLSYTITTGHYSIAWSSATELIMLVLRSHSPDHLGHVSAGVDSKVTFQEPVGIRAKTVDIGDSVGVEERLELVFARIETAKTRE